MPPSEGNQRIEIEGRLVGIEDMPRDGGLVVNELRLNKDTRYLKNKVRSWPKTNWPT